MSLLDESIGVVVDILSFAPFISRIQNSITAFDSEMEEVFACACALT